ncbi:hypothetical protein A6V39_01750 [Candidatus Mycoplasma haematobovis]|uniref:YqaJ viral recombinase domain-containing protein n=1 Tax=Candidatus Mycoplasma haematobovis TaxID=432608 RepID=A0A1A9QE62_9MOLU|nr:hypothetical protein [Candidatus Mycoplasma haematobovis]OAL10767.1 hypothetical protein A6V39_01750 [Candidatus Mycoplasma haematobovis]
MFIACKDFFRKGNKVLLTKEGIERHKRIKLTGTKIPKFFKLKLNAPDEEEEELEEGEEEPTKTPFWVWSSIINFPFSKRRSPRKEEKYEGIERKIRDYISTQLNKNFISYVTKKYDVFDASEEGYLAYLGGVPDGEEISPAGNTLSILEIKTMTDAGSKKMDSRFSDIPLSYLLQIALYLYLRKVDIGWICITYLHHDNWSSLESLLLNTKISLYSGEQETKSGIIESLIEEIGECEFEYQILEAYVNNFLEDNELILFKVRINLEKYDVLIRKLCSWYDKHKYESPDMTDEELNKFISKNKNL